MSSLQEMSEDSSFSHSNKRRSSQVDERENKKKKIEMDDGISNSPVIFPVVILFISQNVGLIFFFSKMKKIGR